MSSSRISKYSIMFSAHVKQLRVLVEAYGCTMNRGEASRAAEMLDRMGHLVYRENDAVPASEMDAVIIFTCDVISSTERRMWKRMREISDSGASLHVAGCLAAVDGREIIERFPDARIMDTMGLDRLYSSVKEHFGMSDGGSRERPGGPEGRLHHIVPIGSGCTGACTYCITRLARGSHSSVPPEEVIGSIREGIARGRKEFLVTSQDTGAYGSDLGNGMDLGVLMRKISDEIDADIRIRVGMMNPDGLMRARESILGAFDGDERFFRFFHVPIQSGSSRILKLMGRRYDADDARALVRDIRNRFPDASISSDVITGFPTETEEDHELTMKMVRELSFDVLNITRFSARKGTPAMRMEGQIHSGVSKERSRELSRLHRELLAGRLFDRMGEHGSCLVTEIGRDGTLMARDGNYVPIVVEGPSELLGEFVDLRTHDVGPTYLLGSII